MQGNCRSKYGSHDFEIFLIFFAVANADRHFVKNSLVVPYDERVPRCIGVARNRVWYFFQSNTLSVSNDAVSRNNEQNLMVPTKLHEVVVLTL